MGTRKDHSVTTSILVIFLGITVFTLGIYGWVENIIKLFNHGIIDFESVIRAIGVFIPPVGAILGYL